MMKGLSTLAVTTMSLLFLGVVQQEFKKLKNKSTVYTVNGSVVGNVVSGGAPGLGKKP